MYRYMLGIAYQKNSTIFYNIITLFIDYTMLISISLCFICNIPLHSIIRTIITFKQLTAYYMYKHKPIVIKQLFNFSPQDLTEAGS